MDEAISLRHPDLDYEKALDSLDGRPVWQRAAEMLGLCGTVLSTLFILP